MNRWKSAVQPWAQLCLLLLSALVGGTAAAQGPSVTLLNASYDPTRTLYQRIDPLFSAAWLKQSGQTVELRASHGGSGAQTRAVMEGLPADVVTLALAADIDALVSHQLVNPGWRDRLPHHATPFTSTIVLLVRRGNPKHIHDWPDLIRPDVSVITANPKTSGGARWAYLAAYGYALTHYQHDDRRARDFVRELYARVPVMDSGSRGSTVTFAQRQMGDVLIAWESEAALAQKEFGADAFDVVIPSISIVAEPPVAVVDRVADRHGTRAVAEAFLRFLYTDDAQEIAAQEHYRPTAEAVLQRHAKDFPKLQMFTVDDLFGGWAKAQSTHFADGGVFDSIVSKRPQ